MRRRRDRVVIYRGADGEWYWRRVSAWNGRITATAGEGYANQSDCLAMAKKINKWATFTIEGSAS